MSRPTSDESPVVGEGGVAIVASRTATIKETIDALWHEIGVRLANAADPQVKREFALARTALEDAQMRYARGRHMQAGTFSPSDVDRWQAEGRKPADVVAERDAAAGKP